MSSDRIRSVLGFEAKTGIADGVAEIVRKIGDARQPHWHNPWFINAEVYRKKIIAEEKTYAMWKSFMDNLKNEFDNLKPSEWPQEGP